MNTAARKLPSDYLMDVEVLVLFSPRMQTGGPGMPDAEVMAKASHCWITAHVSGRHATSELTGRPCIEDFRIEDSDGEDLEPRLTDSILEDIADYVLNF